MSEIIAFILGIWFGGLIVIVSYGGNKCINNKKEVIDIEKIIIKNDFKKHKPKREKMIIRKMYFMKHDEFYSPIVLDENNVLVDGYTSYLIAKEFKFQWVEFIRR